MKQILHIFAKDVRHLRAEILLTLAVTAAFALACPPAWRTAEGMHNFGSPEAYASTQSQLLIGFLRLLVPLSWWLLITNLIHGEKLVGDRQFWITRPCEWKKLLAAKLLFLLVIVYLPLFIAQCAVLAAAGFSPLAQLSGLLFNLLLISAVIILPLVAIATVTSNFARMTLTLLGVSILLVAVVALAYRANLGSILLPWEMDVLLVLLISLCAAAVVSQYATRKTRTAVLLLVAFPVLLLVIGRFIVPARAVVNGSYPFADNTTGAPVTFSYVPFEPNPSYSYTYVGPMSHEVAIQIPLQVSGVANNSIVVVDAVKTTLVSPGGFHWDSDWQLSSGLRIYPGQKIARIFITMPLAVYDQIGSTPVASHLTMAVTQAAAGRVTSIPLPAGVFSVPEFGVCKPEGAPHDPDEVGSLFCMSAMRQPHLTQINMVGYGASIACGAAQPDDGVPDSRWQGSLDPWPAQIGFSPVYFPYEVMPAHFDSTGNLDHGAHLCPGTPITFTRYNVNRRAQIATTFQGYQLPTLTPGQRAVITNQ